MKIQKITMLVLGCLLSSLNSFSQQGYSSGSVSMNRANDVVSADQVVIEEYINYHSHKIPMPAHNNEAALSIDYYNSSPEKLVMMVGITTQQMLDYETMQPINISVVIDKSGSMQSHNKLEKVKKALSKFILGLKAGDYVSIVAYDNTATVILQADKLKNIQNLNNIIESLQPGGSTNLNEGLMLGYKEVLKNYDPKSANKVILLTDGIANQGITDPEEIVKNSGFYNQKGIDVSTIGVGSDLNYALLQQIAKQGKGANHFVGEVEEDIIKVFEDELESLIAPIARNAFLELEYPEELEINYIYGYTPEYKKNRIIIPLNNLNMGLTQVFIMECSLKNLKKELPFKAKLSYFLYESQSDKAITQSLNLQENRSKYPNGEIIKCHYIGKMAKALKQMAGEVQGGKIAEGIAILDAAIQELDNRFPQLKDKDLIRVKEILIKNRGYLK